MNRWLFNKLGKAAYDNGYRDLRYKQLIDLDPDPGYLTPIWREAAKSCYGEIGSADQWEVRVEGNSLLFFGQHSILMESVPEGDRFRIEATRIGDGLMVYASSALFIFLMIVRGYYWPVLLYIPLGLYLSWQHQRDNRNLIGYLKWRLDTQSTTLHHDSESELSSDCEHPASTSQTD